MASPRLQHEQPWMVLHELSHAYHDQVLNFDNAEIKAAWQRFVDSGKYKSVLHMNGHMRPHYGLTNPQEFFAEMSEIEMDYGAVGTVNGAALFLFFHESLREAIARA